MNHDRVEMTADDVLEMVRLFESERIDFFIDGGWGVDALLGSQTRTHADLDLAMTEADAGRARALLEARGFRELLRDDSWECNFVMQDGRGRRIDIHSYTFAPDGSLLHGVPYPAESLSGRGRVSGHAVKCISPEWLVKFHAGYPLDEDDHHDVCLLCERFGIDLPADFEAFQRKGREPADE